MNRYQLLFTTPALSVSRFDHPPHEAHEDPDEEVATRWAIAFVLSGTFDVADGKRWLRLQQGSVLLSRPGTRIRCRHHELFPTDVCLSIGFEPDNVADSGDTSARNGWAVRRLPTPRLAYVGRRLREAAAGGDSFQLERWSLAALSALEDDGNRGMARGRYAARGTTLDAVVTTCRAIELDPSVRRSIGDRALDVGLNSVQLTRAFRRHVGMAPHAYVMRCRLASAAALLEAGVSVSQTCYRSGFENLSHFCRVFRHTFGVRPSRWRTLGRAAQRLKVRELAGRPFESRSGSV